MFPYSSDYIITFNFTWSGIPHFHYHKLVVYSHKG
nr:MAG TPA: hypothetical protein [Caudoviricetes sp.]